MRIFIILFTLISLTTFSQSFVLENNKSNYIEFKHLLKETSNVYSSINGIAYIDFTKSHKVVTHELGAPALPVFHTTVQLPARGNVSFQIIYEDVDTLENVLVTPSKGNLKRNVIPSEIPYTFGKRYQLNEFYPNNSVALNNPVIWRTVRAQNIAIQPYRYNPVTKQLLVAHTTTVRILVDATAKGINEIKVSALDPVLSNSQSNMLLNPNMNKYVSKDENGSMLVIGDSTTYYATIQPFIKWKNQRGLVTKFVSTTLTGTTPEGIKAFVSTYYQQHPECLYLLLVGDHAQIPAYSYGESGPDILYSDSYYGQLLGGTSDFYPELFVGRFSGTAAEVKLIVEKTIKYEKDPEGGDWMERGIGLASNEGIDIGDEGEPDWLHSRNLRSKLKSFGYSDVYEFYDGSHGGEDANGNPSADKISLAVNTGAGLMNYTGHGDVNTCNTGYFFSSHVRNLVNGGKNPFVVSVACNNGLFVYGDCISEVWMKSEDAGKPAGAIAATGSTILMAWAQPMQTQDELVDLITKTSNFPTKKTLGGLFYNAQLSMFEKYPDSSGIEVIQTWAFFGDPSTVFRNRITQDISVAHSDVLNDTIHTFNMLCDVNGALIALSQNGKLLGTGVVENGKVTIQIDTLNPFVNLDIVATKQNYKAFMGEVLSLDSQTIVANVNVFPNPANSVIKVKSNISITHVQIVDFTGQQVFFANPGLAGEFVIDVEQFDAGVYFVLVTTDEGIVNERVVVIH